MNSGAHTLAQIPAPNQNKLSMSLKAVLKPSTVPTVSGVSRAQSSTTKDMRKDSH